MSITLYLCVKWVELQLINTFECLGVDLLEGDPVLCSLEDVDLLHDMDRALSEVPLPGDGHLSLVVPLSGLLVLSVGEHNKGNPELGEFYLLKILALSSLPCQFHLLKDCLMTFAL